MTCRRGHAAHACLFMIWHDRPDFVTMLIGGTSSAAGISSNRDIQPKETHHDLANPASDRRPPRLRNHDVHFEPLIVNRRQASDAFRRPPAPLAILTWNII